MDGEFPREWSRYVQFAKPAKRGRVTPRQLEKFIYYGLLEPRTDDAGKKWHRVVAWRDLHPLEWTGAVRQERWRERHGVPATYGRRQPPSPDSTRDAPEGIS